MASTLYDSHRWAPSIDILDALASNNSLASSGSPPLSVPGAISAAPNLTPLSLGVFAALILIVSSTLVFNVYIALSASHLVRNLKNYVTGTGAADFWADVHLFLDLEGQSTQLSREIAVSKMLKRLESLEYYSSTCAQIVIYALYQYDADGIIGHVDSGDLVELYLSTLATIHVGLLAKATLAADKTVTRRGCSYVMLDESSY